MPELMLHQFVSSFVCVDTPAVLLHFDPGTGKTATAIDVMKTNRTKKGARYVVIVPAFLVNNWLNEFKMWWPEASVSVQGHKGKDADINADVILTSYDRAPKVEGSIRLRRYVVYDEAHYLCGTSKRAEFALTACKQYKLHQLILMTGTPINNRVLELYPLLLVLDAVSNMGFRKSYASRHKFATTFCEWRERHIPGVRFPVREYFGLRNQSVLKLWTDLWFIRFKLEEVLELPDLLQETIHVEGVNDKLQALLEKAWELSPSGLTPESFQGDMVGEHISTAKALTALAKCKATAEFAGTVRGPVVIFTDHVQAAEDLARILGTHGTIAKFVTGQTSMAVRSRIVDSFQRGEIDYFVGTIGSCGVGINLTKACTVIINDYSWVPSRNEQAIARVYRYGQENKVVVYSVTGGKVDTRITKLLQEKMTVIKEMDT